jgi:hypothetical protein
MKSYLSIFRTVAAAALATMAVMAGLSAPVQAAPADSWAFAYVDDPTAPVWTNLAPAYQATSPASPNAQGGRLATGRFRVRFLGIGSGRDGNVHVTAVDRRGNYCEIVAWGPSRFDQVVDVACFEPGGNPADTPFTVLWTFNSTLLPTTAGSFASVQYSAPAGAAVQFYNSTGAGVGVTPIGTGVTVIRFEKVGVGHSLVVGNLQVTALDRAAKAGWCKVGAWDDSNLDIIAIVYCFDAGGAFADKDFTASYQRVRPVVAAAGPPKYFGYVWTRLPLSPNALETNYNNVVAGFGANTVTFGGPVTDVTFPRLARVETHVQVTAFGPNADYCTLFSLWTASGADLNATAICFDPSGAPAADELFMAATNRI